MPHLQFFLEKITSFPGVRAVSPPRTQCRAAGSGGGLGAGTNPSISGPTWPSAGRAVASNCSFLSPLHGCPGPGPCSEDTNSSLAAPSFPPPRRGPARAPQACPWSSGRPWLFLLSDLRLLLTRRPLTWPAGAAPGPRSAWRGPWTHWPKAPLGSASQGSITTPLACTRQRLGRWLRCIR